MIGKLFFLLALGLTLLVVIVTWDQKEELWQKAKVVLHIDDTCKVKENIRKGKAWIHEKTAP